METFLKEYVTISFFVLSQQSRKTVTNQLYINAKNSLYLTTLSILLTNSFRGQKVNPLLL